MNAARFLIEGRVQGVMFRATTRAEALRLGLYGWARNLPDGRVEVVAEGLAESLDELERFLHAGPVLAEVRAVHREAIEVTGRQNFGCG